MIEQDEIIFRRFVKGLSIDDRVFLIKEYSEMAEKLKPLMSGPKK